MARTPWRVRMSTSGEPTGLLIVHVLGCQAAFGALTRPQRAVLLAAEGGQVSGDPRPMAALRARGLADEADHLTEAGQQVRFWNLPAGHPERLAARQINEERGGPTE